MRNLALLCLFAAAALCAADFKTGLDAYNRGDFAAALSEWQPIATAGDPHAEYNLGLLYARGQGVPQDYKQAVAWYQKAAEQGVAAAQYNLGVMYANGQGVAANPQEASKWFLKAAEQGVSDAANGLGRMYYEGEGAFRNYCRGGEVVSQGRRRRAWPAPLSISASCTTSAKASRKTTPKPRSGIARRPTQGYAAQWRISASSTTTRKA